MLKLNINPYLPSGLDWTSSFQNLGVSGVLFFIFILFRKEILVSKQCRPDQMQHSNSGSALFAKSRH